MTDLPRHTADPAFVRRAVWRLSLVELWERYSFYTVFTLMALFLAAPSESGGLGWSRAAALQFFGTFLLANQLTQIVGGYVTDALITRLQALRIGSLLLLLGQALMTAPSSILWLTRALAPGGSAGGCDLGRIPLGLWQPPSGLPVACHGLYNAVTLAFYVAIALIAVGSGLFKPVLTVIVGRLPHETASDRDTAFTTFFLFNNIGGLAAALIGGALAQRLGWGAAFAASSIGMVCCLVTMRIVEARYITPFAFVQERSLAPSGSQLAAPPSSGWLLVIVLALYLAACSLTYQAYGFVSLFSESSVDRQFLGLSIPPSWFVAVNTATIMAGSAGLLSLWRHKKLGYDWTPWAKLALAFALVGIGFALLAGAALQSRAQGLASPLWIIGTMILIGLGELLISPTVMSMVIRAAPAHRHGLSIGILSGVAGVGAWMSGLIGALAIGPATIPILLTLVIVAAVGALALACGRQQFTRQMS